MLDESLVVKENVIPENVGVSSDCAVMSPPGGEDVIVSLLDRS